ncbi:Piso0_005515 [Millerozyma farinosa CBS 7064]|uniref:Piso0_005515 protein n=1 Tax=Pichia sorbitophila (strain ATCC MYA-4447 / BCRC 22081 / CBS 7064 / NBRC 10061 / NRRL Y-12695) TaxID=559304 RepID=G8XZ81_PICSO|nr:Piso0_005515 [Millerozyma farinosa CBS 7064]
MSLASNRSFFKNFTPSTAKDTVVSGGQGSEVITSSINLTGTRIVYSRTDKTIRIWKSTQERLVDPLVIEHPHARAVESISFNPKTEFTFATVGRDDVVKIWRCTGVLEKEIAVSRDSGEGKVACSLVSYSTDGELLCAIDRDSTVYLYAVSDGYRKVSEMVLPERVYAVQWFNSGHSFFMCGLSNGTAHLYKVEDAADSSAACGLRHVLKGHRSAVTDVAIDPRGRYFVLGSSEGVVSVWETATMLCSKVISNTDDGVSHISISRDGTYIAVSYDNGPSIKIFEYESTEQIYEVPNSAVGKLTLTSLQWFPSKTAFVYTSDNSRSITLMKKSEK